MFTVLIIAVPLTVLLSFIICLSLYLKTQKKETSPDSEKEKRKLANLRTACLVTGIISAVFVFTIVAGGILFMMFMKSM